MNVKTNRKRTSGPEFTKGPVNYKLQFMGKGSYVPEAIKQKSKAPKRQSLAMQGNSARCCVATYHL
jgi:hypothetical protein